MPDIVVIGAGPAGLACAHALRGLDVLVLEREPQHGGRVRTIDLAGQRVDMGACFAFDAALLPAHQAARGGALIRERAALGLCDDGTIHLADTPLECLFRLPLDHHTRNRIEVFARGHGDAGALRNTPAYALVNALLHQLHPGELGDYAATHQRDGLYVWYPDHWEAGNRCLVDALLEESGARLQCDAEVKELRQHADRIAVRYKGADGEHELECRALVIATTADVARALLGQASPGQQPLLEATRYASYLVVALGGAATPALGEFRSLVPRDGSPAVIMQQRSLDRQRATLSCFFCDTEFAAHAALTDAELAALARQRITALGVSADALETLRESAVMRWTRAATILSGDYRHSRAQRRDDAGDAIFLAGDYASPEPAVGYGIEDAVASGVHAARRVRALLEH